MSFIGTSKKREEGLDAYFQNILRSRKTLMGCTKLISKSFLPTDGLLC